LTPEQIRLSFRVGQRKGQLMKHSNDGADFDILKAEAIYYNFGNNYGDEVEITRPVAIRKTADGTHYVQSADGYVTMVPPGFISADIIPLPGESVLG
jgi:hypothetical protein